MSLIKRLVLLGLGLVAAFYAVRLGAIIPWTTPFSAWTGDFFSRYDLLMVVVSVIAVVGTTLAVWVWFEDFGKNIQKTHVSLEDVFWIMLFLAVSSMAFGMHLKPAGTNPVDWVWAAPFIWQIAAVFALVPTFFVVINLVIELLVADSAHEKRILDDGSSLEAQTKGVANLVGMTTTAVNNLAQDLQSHRENVAHRMDQADSRDKVAAELLNSISKALTEILARLPPAPPKVVEGGTTETKVAA